MPIASAVLMKLSRPDRMIPSSSSADAPDSCAASAHLWAESAIPSSAASFARPASVARSRVFPCSSTDALASSIAAWKSRSDPRTPSSRFAVSSSMFCSASSADTCSSTAPVASSVAPSAASWAVL